MNTRIMVNRMVYLNLIVVLLLRFWHNSEVFSLWLSPLVQLIYVSIFCLILPLEGIHRWPHLRHEGLPAASLSVAFNRMVLNSFYHLITLEHDILWVYIVLRIHCLQLSFLYFVMITRRYITCCQHMTRGHRLRVLWFWIKAFFGDWLGFIFISRTLCILFKKSWVA